MSTFRVPVIRIGKVGRHPNADTLSITQVEGCPVILRTGDFQPDDLAIYVPVDSVVPLSNPAFAFLATKEGQVTVRIKAKKLRGIFSMGLLIKPPEPMALTSIPVWEVGQNAAEYYGIVKYEEPENLHTGGEQESDPGICPVYDMESYRKYKHLLIPEEEVVVTEKIHGTNGRFAWHQDRLWVGSHKTWRRESEGNVWWKAARQLKLGERLAQYPGYVLYAEVYGSVQDLKYGVGPGKVSLVAFDIFNSTTGRWLNHDEMSVVCAHLQIPKVPILYRGPFVPEMVEPHADGKTVLAPATHIREGFVIKPTLERFNEETGRTIFKLVSEAYLLRNGGTEFH